MNRKVVSMMAIGTVVAVFGYVRVFRPRILRWGATDEELARPMPGDELVPSPTFNATRSITIDARPEDIWPWLVQMGFGRAGWYSYDWLDNLGRPSARHVMPELQDVEVGDRVPMSWWTYQTVKAFEPNSWLLWQDQSGGTWVWALYPLDQRRTRLVTRMRGRYRWNSLSTIPALFLMEVGDPIMIPKELKGIKDRAEGLAAEHRLQPPNSTDKV
jgi:hypothetical protein